MKTPLLIIGSIALAAVGVGVWYSAADNIPEVQFSDIEAGFEEAENPADVASVGVKNEQQIPQQVAASGGFSRWGFYWRGFF